MPDRNVDLFHRIVVRVALVTLPFTFVVELVSEATDGDSNYFPRWYIYAPFLGLAIWQSFREKPNALWLLIPAMAFVPIASVLEWTTKTQIGGVESASALMLLLLLGFSATLMVDRWPAWASFVFVFVVAGTAAVSAMNDAMEATDLILRTTVAGTAVALASWLAFNLHQGLLQSVADQRALVDSRDRLVAAVSHELRTPLTAIAGLSEEIADRGQDLSPDELYELAGVIAEQSADMTHIIEDLLTAAQARAGSIHIQRADIDLAHEVRKVATSPALTSVLADKTLRTDLDAIHVRADPQRCRQILRNLLTNAVRYGGDDVSVTATVEGDIVRMSVSDNGRGLGSADADKVFEPFFTGTPNSAQPGSVGLGLSVSRQLAEQMGGGLRYVRSPQRTTFELELPAAATSPTPSVPTAPAAI